MAQGPAFDFEAEWPQLEGHLRGVLSQHRVPTPLRDDIIQETGVRLWKLRSRVDPARSVRSLATTIALNLLRDHVRRERHLSYGTDLVDLEVPDNVEEEVVARDELRRARWAWSSLSANYQRALLAGIHGDQDLQPVSASVRMMKMRARKQLRYLMDNVARAKAGCGFLTHKMWDAVANRFGVNSVRGEQLAHVAGAAVMLMAIAIVPTLPVDERARTGLTEVAPPSVPSGGLANTASYRSKATLADDLRLILAAERMKKVVREREEARRVLARIGPVTYYEGRSVASGTLVVELGNLQKTSKAIASVDLKSSIDRPAPRLCGFPTGSCKDRTRK